MKPLYARVLGSAWHQLPAPLRSMHDVTSTSDVEASGQAVVQRGRGMLARVLAFCMALPNASPNTVLRVTFKATARGEYWERHFGTRSFTSTQSAPRRSQEGDGLINERVGPVQLTFRLVYDDDRLRILPHAWRVFGIPLPRRHLPVRSASEWIDDAGRFAFEVIVEHAWTGPIVCYRGWLVRTI